MGMSLIFLLMINILQLFFLFGHGRPLSIVDRSTTYIVHVASPPGGSELLGDKVLESWHRSFLPSTEIYSSGDQRLVYSYRHVISGFAARLTPEEAESVASMDGFVHAEPDQVYRLKTTYTPQFLNLSQVPGGVWDKYDTMGEGIVIGIIDSGIIAGPHPSFVDDWMDSPPSRWKGTCEFSACNNKVIGAVAYVNGIRSNAVDDPIGHGTHVASIAAGNFVDDVTMDGTAMGVASGMAPRAHLAIYKVCNVSDCSKSDITKAVDQAIIDGVDVINLSIGYSISTFPIHEDYVDIGSLAAARKGIFAVTVSGNEGARKSTLEHGAPWALVVGSSTKDRHPLGHAVRAPEVSHFSSRGPSRTNGGILKPDVLAPGDFIIGAWTGPDFVYQSGTSEAAPHISGIIALLKTAHPDWSPAAIQSAIITSARDHDLQGEYIQDENNHKRAKIHDRGAGQVNPAGAMDPGLVYDVNPDDYFAAYLCGLNYTNEQVTKTAGGESVDCSKIETIKPWEINYPSIEVVFKFESADAVIKMEIERTVTNVGPAKSTYRARIVEPVGVKVHLHHHTLHFDKINEKKSFKVKLSASYSSVERETSYGGKLEWVSDKHVVTTPISFRY